MAGQANLKSGIHSKLFKVTGRVPSLRGARQLQRDMDLLEKTLEEITPEINAKKVLLIRQVVRTETLIRLIEGYMKQHGILQPFKARRSIMELQPAVAGAYLSLMTQQRNSIMALGLDPKQLEAVKAPYEIVEAEK
jgi:hypothetical protein